MNFSRAPLGPGRAGAPLRERGDGAPPPRPPPPGQCSTTLAHSRVRSRGKRPAARTLPLPASGGSYCEELVASSSCANNVFAFSAGQELGSLIAPLALHAPLPQQACFPNADAFYHSHQQGGGRGGGNCCPPPSPPASLPFSFQPLRRLSESPVFDDPPSPPDSLSDRESNLSGSLNSGSLSGSESPSLDSGRCLPIFSRLCISDD